MDLLGQLAKLELDFDTASNVFDTGGHLPRVHPYLTRAKSATSTPLHSPTHYFNSYGQGTSHTHCAAQVASDVTGGTPVAEHPNGMSVQAISWSKPPVQMRVATA